MIYYAVRDEDGILGDIIEFDGDFVPDGDGIEIDMNGISYSDYLKNINDYAIVGWKLMSIRDL